MKLDDIKKSKIRKLITEKMVLEKEEAEFNKSTQKKNNEIMVKKQSISNQLLEILDMPADKELTYNELILKIL